MEQHRKNPVYELWILRNDGPDDNDWDLEETFNKYNDCISRATALHDKGYWIKIFDPFMGQTYKFPEDFGGK